MDYLVTHDKEEMKELFDDFKEEASDEYECSKIGGIN